MPTEVKLWQIEKDKPKPVDPNKVNLESRLENWIHDDISLVSDDLLVIGKQIITEYGGKIDLLAVDSDANLVILELKKDQTPREVVAQALDYASWVQQLDYERIEEISSKVLGTEKSLEQVFKERFEDDLPEIVNSSHRIYIVAPESDGPTERIIEYLSETYGVDINMATFAYFKTAGGVELIGRSMLLDEDVRPEDRKRKRSLSEAELREIAEKNGVVELWDKAIEEFRSLSQGKLRKQGRILFRVRLDEGLRKCLTVFPGDSSKSQVLPVEVERNRVSKYFNISKDQIREVCGSDEYRISFDTERLDAFICLLKSDEP